MSNRSKQKRRAARERVRNWFITEKPKTFSVPLGGEVRRSDEHAPSPHVDDVISEEQVESLKDVQEPPYDAEAEAERLVKKAVQDGKIVAVEIEQEALNSNDGGLTESRWVGSREFAKSIGRGVTYVKDHGEELGGRKNERGHWEFPLTD